MSNLHSPIITSIFHFTNPTFIQSESKIDVQHQLDQNENETRNHTLAVLPRCAQLARVPVPVRSSAASARASTYEVRTAPIARSKKPAPRCQVSSSSSCCSSKSSGSFRPSDAWWPSAPPSLPRPASKQSGRAPYARASCCSRLAGPGTRERCW